MPTYYLCPFCETPPVAFEKYNQIRAHFMGKHRDVKEDWPSRENTEIEELPEGVNLIKAPKKKALVEEEEVGVGTIEKEVEKLKVRPGIETVTEELSGEAKHLYELLQIHGVKTATIDTIVGLYDKLDLYKDPRNLANLLKQRLDKREQFAMVPILFELFPEREAELPYMMPPGGGGTPWYGRSGIGSNYPYYPSRTGTPSGYPQYPGYYQMAEKSSLDKYIDLLMAERVGGEKGEGAKISPEVETRLGGIESVLEKMVTERAEEERESKAVSSVKSEISELKAAIDKITEEKERQAIMQPLIDKIAFMEKSHKEEMSRLATEITERKGKGEETNWLQQYMTERDKRHEDEATRYREDLHRLTDEMTKSKEKEASAYKQAFTDFTTDRDKIEAAKRSAVEELKGQGWTGRERDFEERVLDIVEHQAAPAVIGEVKEGRKTLQDIARRLGGAAPETAAKEATPISDEEASRLAEVMSLEEEMKGLSSKKPPQ